MSVSPFYSTPHYPDKDGAIRVLARIAAAFAPHCQEMPNMTVVVGAGYVLNGTTLTELAAQTTGTITAPTTNPRIDRVVIDDTTGIVSVATGTEAAAPTPPAIPTGKIPVAQVALATSTSAIDNGVLTDERAFFRFPPPSAAGKLVQIQYFHDGAYTTGTGTIPLDDTIPQNTEGDERLSVTITPESNTNRLVIETLVNVSSSASSTTFTTALFQDSTANALAAARSFGGGNETVVPTLVKHEMAAGTTSATTFKTRVGGDAGTTAFNGASGARNYGGVMASYIQVTEYKT